MAKKTLHRSAAGATPANKQQQEGPECFTCTMRYRVQENYGSPENFRDAQGVDGDFCGLVAMPGNVDGEAYIFHFLMADGAIMSVMPYRTADIEQIAESLLTTADGQRARAAADVTPAVLSSKERTPASAVE